LAPSYDLERPVKSHRIALGLTAALAAAVVAVAAAPAGAVLKKPVTLRFATKLTKLTPVPVSGQTSAAPQPGDYVVITDDYLKNGKVVGHDLVHCILVTTEHSLCFAAVDLPGGQLELQGIGPAGGSGNFTIAVTGGTGRYANARGTAQIISGPNNTGTEIFRLRP
jgi:hypothetical protein